MNVSAYLLPENLTPEDDFCARVYIPNEDEYRRAFLGAYMFFGKWVAWERDDNHSAAIAASRWRDAIDRTMELWGDGCDDCVSDEMIDEIINEVLERMTITINNTNCCCGGSGSSGSLPGSPPPDGVGDSVSPPVVSGGDIDMPDDTVTANQCAMAHYFLMTWRNVCLDVANGNVSQSGFSEYLAARFSGLFDWTVDVAQMVLEVAGIFVYLPPYAWTVASEIDANYNAMQCAILSGGGESAMFSALNGIIDGMTLNFWTKYSMKKVLSYLPLYAVFDSNMQSEPIPSEYTTRGCPDCVEEALDPNEYDWSVNFQFTAGIENWSYVGDVIWEIDSDFIGEYFKFNPTTARSGYVRTTLANCASHAGYTLPSPADYELVSVVIDIQYGETFKARDKEMQAHIHHDDGTIYIFSLNDYVNDSQRVQVQLPMQPGKINESIVVHITSIESGTIGNEATAQAALHGVEMFFKAL